METDKIQRIIEGIYAKLAISFIGLLVLVIFFDGFATFGIAQILIIIALHLLCFYLLSTDVDNAIIAIWIAIVWNAGIAGYGFYVMSESSYYEDTSAIKSLIAAGIYFTIDYIIKYIRLERLR